MKSFMDLFSCCKSKSARDLKPPETPIILQDHSTPIKVGEKQV